MSPRFNLYFAEDEADLLERGKKEIDNLSEFFKNILRDHLCLPTVQDIPASPEVSAPNPALLFERKFADFSTEADIRTVFEDRIGAEQALKNRLAELRRACPAEFHAIKELFKARYPRYAKITDEL